MRTQSSVFDGVGLNSLLNVSIWASGEELRTGEIGVDQKKNVGSRTEKRASAKV